MSHGGCVNLCSVQQSKQTKAVEIFLNKWTPTTTASGQMNSFLFLVWLFLIPVRGNPVKPHPSVSPVHPRVSPDHPSESPDHPSVSPAHPSILPHPLLDNVNLLRNSETSDVLKEPRVVCDDSPSCNTTCPELYGHKIDENGCKICNECRTSGSFEGDIVIDEKVYERIACAYDMNECDATKDLRGAATSTYDWPKTGEFVTIGYTFEGTSSTKRTNILNAIEEYNRLTCIRFVPRTNQVNYINFVGDDTNGCSSYVGFINRGAQMVKIGTGCDTNQGTILHELMHALGFWHEQSRGDRDDHVDVKINNVIEDARNNFDKRTSSSWNPLGSPYDLSSVMHYGGTFFAKGELPTITEKGRAEPVLAQRFGFSKQDLFQINTKYRCTAYLSNTGTTMSTTTVSLSNCRDFFRTCQQAARQGFCQFSQYQRGCPRSCTPCAGVTTTFTTTTSPTPPTSSLTSTTSTSSRTTSPIATMTTTSDTSTTPASTATVSTSLSTASLSSTTTIDSCKDLKEECRTWAHKNFCNEEFVDYMRKNCPRACGHCTPTSPPQCEDDYGNCMSWASNGECTSSESEQFMKAYCKLSCTRRGIPFLCGPGATTLAAPTTTPRTACVDFKPYCRHWARKGYCSEEGVRGGSVRNNCPKSCERCRLGTTKPATPATDPVVVYDNGVCGTVITSGRKRKRAVGGRDVAYGSSPWMVSLQRGSEHFCGATLISNQHIITAAHCFYSGSVYIGDINRINGYLGKQRLVGRDVGEIRVAFVNITIHPLFDYRSRDNDIAILKISSPVVITNYIRLVCLPSPSMNALGRNLGTVTGWGRQKRPVGEQSIALQKVDVAIISNRECQEWLGPYTNYNSGITSNMLCAGYRSGGRDSCQGDDGGPLISKYGNYNYLFGIVSWGHDCAKPKRPGVYTRVSEKMEWIQDVIQSI